MLGVAVSSAQPPEGSSTEDIERRVAAILKQMSLEEKIDYIGGVDRFYIRSIERLGIPRFKMADGPLGVRNYGPATAMAGGIALAASWDAALAERVGAEIGRDARARGVHFLLGPGVNIYRAPMNGRNFEYFGEDPFLASAIAVEYIEGIQKQGVCATVKHFTGNNSEFDRRKTDALIDARTLREIYLPVFEAAVREAGVGAIMTAYNRTNGLYMSQNGYLNNEIVKKEWGFDGVIMSDWTSTFDGVAAANGGLDLEMPYGACMNRENLLPAVRQQKVSPETIDDKVRRILRTAVRFGWLDRDQTDATIPRYSLSGRDVALDAARGSMVLLKNEDSILPLSSEKVKTIAVLGPNAHPAVVTGGGSARVTPFTAVSFLEGLTEVLEGGIDVYYHPGIPDPGEIADATRFYTAPSSGSPGMHLELFDNMELSGEPVWTCMEPRVGSMENTGEIPQTFSSARWTGYFIPTEAGNYDVFVQIPGERIGYRLYVDDRLVLDAWNYSKALMDAATVPLENGPHKVVLELVRGGSGYAGGKLRLGIALTGSLVDSEALALARQSDAVVVAAGFNPETESESGDRTFRLPFGQDALIKEIAANNKNTIVAITSGGGVDMMQWHDSVPAIIETWYPGQEGGRALGEILMGRTNPSGRLPVSFEKRPEDNPTFEYYYPKPGTDGVEYGEGVFVGYRGYERNKVEPLFPFGYGLSYTTFEYRDLEIMPVAPGKTGEMAPAAEFDVSFEIENTGDREGSEVAQLYVGFSGTEIQRPLKELKGFVKVALNPGEEKRVSVRLDRRAFCYYDIREKRWKVETGEMEILVGRSSEQIELSAKIRFSEIAEKEGNGSR
ncbi:MAG: glycoside hydrolase family 3 C-terminal domain-containing protein [Acidobacteria bacterium]|nr:glycoside hydrolase family 3 C-terminal domain-containing protein [Acidobacteriota bacterium]